MLEVLLGQELHNVAVVVTRYFGGVLLGTGMSLCMTELGALLDGHLGMVIGILVGLVGLVMVALAYPVYNSVLKKERERIAPEILRLTDELLK